MNADASVLNGWSERVIGCALTVANALGHGFLEKVYENALVHELREGGLRVVQQRRVVVRYKGIVVGEYVADLVVENLLILEVKAVRALDDGHIGQCVNYLKAADLHLCLALNFGRPRLEIRRVVWNMPGR